MKSGTLDRRTFLAAGGGALAATGCALPTADRDKAPRPNILMIIPDQLRAQALGCTGNPDVRTPHIDQLASEGILFRNTVANSPVCCPARANIMTGLYPHKNGMVANDLRLRESEVTFAEVLRDAGYRTGFIGKWHLDGGKRLPGYVPPGPRRQGFDFWAANECDHRHFSSHYFRDSDQPIPINRFEVEAWTDVAIEFLRQSANEDRPFCLCIMVGPPHDPYGAPERYMKMYDPVKLSMRPNWRPADGVPGPKDIAAYYAAVTAVDDQVARLMATLDDLRLAEDTILLFSSDHGDMLGSHGQRLKRKPWEESIRIPGILRYPRKGLHGRQMDMLFSHVDFAPTLLGLCGLPPVPGMQGTNLSEHVQGRTSGGPDSAYFQIFGPYRGDGTEDGWRGVRTLRYMYARYRSRPWVLYDLENDPYQLNNLVDDPLSAYIREQMEKRLADWMDRTGDSWSRNWSHLVEDAGRLYRHETFYTVDEYLEWARQHPELDRKEP